MGGGQFFANLCGRLLWTAPYLKRIKKFSVLFLYIFISPQYLVAIL